jgi:hypothetical protein
VYSVELGLKPGPELAPPLLLLLQATTRMLRVASEPPRAVPTVESETEPR